jgi:Tol biopolymer transport system component
MSRAALRQSLAVALLGLSACAAPLPVLQPTATPPEAPAAAATGGPLSVLPTATPAIEQAVFTSRRNGNEEIYRINLDGSGLVRLTEHPARDFRAALSPDGLQTAFVSNRGGNEQVYLIDSNGANLRRLTNEPLGAADPVFAVDGNALYYVAIRITGRVLMRYDVTAQTHTMLLTSPAEIAEPAPSPDGKRIAFVARDGRETGLDIFLANLDRTGAVINLTNRPGVDAAPSWSPDGTRLVFHSDRDGDFDIFTMAADGSAQTPVIDSANDETQPVWSRDGRTLLFVAGGDLYRTDDSGSAPTAVTVTAAEEAEPQLVPASRLRTTDQLLLNVGTNNRALQLASMTDGTRRQLAESLFDDILTAAWSPDGAQVVFSADRSGNYDLYVLNADGSGLRRLTDHPARDLHPAWSPDGQTIAFETNRNGNWDIYFVPAAGGAAVPFTSDTADEGNPSWAPDGSRLVFAANSDGNFDLYIATADGRTARRRLTDDPADDVYPAWSPSQELIVFRSNRSGDNELYLITTEGRTRRLTFHDADDTTPTFSPDGSEVAFASNRATLGGTSGVQAQHDIFVIATATLELRRVVNSGDDERYPAWRPR